MSGPPLVDALDYNLGRLRRAINEVVRDAPDPTLAIPVIPASLPAQAPAQATADWPRVDVERVAERTPNPHLAVSVDTASVETAGVETLPGTAAAPVPAAAPVRASWMSRLTSLVRRAMDRS